MALNPSADAPQATSLQVGVVVRDLEETTPFYRDGLGLAHEADLPLPFGIQRRFACGHGVVKLLQPTEPPTMSNPPGGIKGGTIGLRWFSVRVTGIEEVVRRCVATGGVVVAPVEEWQPGLKVAMLEDPEHSCWIEVFERKGAA